MHVTKRMAERESSVPLLSFFNLVYLLYHDNNVDILAIVVPLNVSWLVVSAVTVDS